MSDSSSTSISIDQMDYMNLLVTQLQNQNPLDPMDNTEMASQLAQYSTLEQLESMNTSFESALASSERSYAASLIGKEISFITEAGDGSQELTRGVVEEVYNDLDGEIILSVEDYAISLDDVVTVTD
jgi:flagellar basal-body rod modification protein FlgD